MQIVKVTYAEFFNANVVTPAMVLELAQALGYSAEAAAKLATAKLSKPTKNVANCPDAKLRTCVLQKLQQPNELVSNFAHGNSFEFEFTHLPDVQAEPDIGAAGANNSRKARASSSGAKGKLTGAYKVMRKDGLRCTEQTDPEKFALWQHVWQSGTFEQYFAQAPAKAVTRTGRIITASSEMLWAIKCGWVVPVTAE